MDIERWEQQIHLYAYLWKTKYLKILPVATYGHSTSINRLRVSQQKGNQVIGNWRTFTQLNRIREVIVHI
jgi:hypothetical protein